MKLFSLKDLLIYTSSCFLNCPISNSYSITILNKNTTPKFVTPIFSSSHFQINLENLYNQKISLIINLNKNQFLINSSRHIPNIKSYLENKSLYYKYRCSNCLSSLSTNSLSFDLLNNLVLPITLHQEIINFPNIILKNYFDQNKSSIITNKILETKLLPSYSYSKNQLLNKLKTYILFS